MLSLSAAKEMYLLLLWSLRSCQHQLLCFQQLW